MNKCENCNVEFKPGYGSTGKFCGRSCAATVNNRKYPKRGDGSNKKRPCLRCGQSIESYLSTRKYCSRTCSSQHRSERYISRWLLGKESGSIASGELISCVRKYLLAQAQNACTLCGWSVPNPTTGKVILTIDHVDGNWQNNAVDNLIVLCYNCHTLTPTFGSLNRGNGVGPRSIGSRRH